METARQRLRESPHKAAGIFSKLFRTWTIPTFSNSYLRDHGIDDMYQPLECDRSEALGDRLEKEWNKQNAKSKNPSFALAVLKTFWREYLTLSCLFGLQSIVFRIVQSMLLGQYLEYFRESSGMPYMNAFLYASGFVFVNAVNIVILTHYYTNSWTTGMKVRLAVCSMIYRKALRLSHTALSGTGAGKIVNLLSNDVSRFEYLSMSLDTIWAAPLLLLIVGVLLWRDIGWAGIAGISVVLSVVVIQSFNARLASKFRLKTALCTDERIRFMDDIISGVQVIKMYAWEMPFAKLIALARKMELKYVKLNNCVCGVQTTLSMFTMRAAVFCTMLSITLLYGSEQITASKVFQITVYLMALCSLVLERFVIGVTEISESMVCFGRLQNFLELDEKKKESRVGSSNAVKSLVTNVLVSLENVTARWVLPQITNPMESESLSSIDECYREIGPLSAVLNDVSANFKRGQLIGIVGPVGAGKSSLLRAILHELPIECGSIQINGTMSYASQEPWIFSGSVRQNILFGQEYDKERYDAVVESCALHTDFKQLSESDQTVVGERGISLSGGQKARINLARAIYRRSDIYLLDDPLSAVDTHVGAHIFSKCIGPMGSLAHLNATRILVTHQDHFLEAADWIIVLQSGRISAQGTPEDLVKSGITFVKWFKDDSETLEDKLIFDSQTPENMLSGNFDDLKEKAQLEQCHVASQLEKSSKKKVNGSTMMTYFKAGAHWSTLVLLLASFLATQFVASAVDIWISVWVKFEEERLVPQDLNQTEFNSFVHKKSTELFTFWSYIPLFEPSTEFYVNTLGILIIMILAISLLRLHGFLSMCTRASQKLHDGMFNGLISTKMHFFDTNPSGRVLNRFAKDIGVIDGIPRMMLDAGQVILKMAGVVAVTAYVNPIFLIPILLMGTVFFFIRRIYLRTSRSIKHLEASARSPVFTHLAATLNGLSTIRANKAEDILTKEFDYHQDKHTSYWSMFIMTNSAFGLSLDVMVFIFMTCIINFFMVVDGSGSGDEIGLAITQILSIAELLQWAVRQSAEVSNNMTAVERILEYRNLEPETEPKEPNDVDKDWPTNGCIEFRNVFYRYSAGAEPVLHNLSFVIRPREKIGIVGRTGAGKSSLIGALFRMASTEGEIIIDGVDTSNVSLKKLRSSIAIIPQDPVLFSGTLRSNLDPFEEYANADIWSALEKVELKEIASGQLELNSPVMAHGSNCSVGQRQLICLARAILRKNRVLILDEATANVDPKTDELIQATIREEFSQCTVLTIAHRLHTIIDSDRILVIENGQAIEFDQAHLLLQNESGLFAGMVKTLGVLEYKRLAKNAYNNYSAINDAHTLLKKQLKDLPIRRYTGRQRPRS